MSLGRLLLRNFVFHLRGNFAVLLGVIVGSAVLTGALLVGDSLRGSLRELTLRQLGWVEHAMVSGRFVRDELANELKADHVAPALLLQGGANSGDGTDPFSAHRAGRVVILGVDDRFWPGGDPPVSRDFWRPTKPGDYASSGVVLNATLARVLEAKVGEKVELSFQKTSTVPRESLLGQRQAKDVLDSLTLTVRAILPDEDPGARFSLNPNPEAPRNAFVPLSVLQAKLGLPGRVNALLVSGPREPLQQQLKDRLTLDDWNLTILGPEERAQTMVSYLDPSNRDGTLRRQHWQGRVSEELAKMADADGLLHRKQIAAYLKQEHPYLSLESKQSVLEDAVQPAALAAAKEAKLDAAPTLVYLADTIADGITPHSIPYAVVGALDLSLLPPLGPGRKQPLDDEGIVLTDWKQSPLRAKVDSPIRLVYYRVKDQGRLEPESATLTLRDRLPLTGWADDSFLTPEYRGITDKLDKRSWENPTFPYDEKRITKNDSAYWNRYRTTPHAYVTLKKGQELFGSRFGKLTSIRLAPTGGEDLDQVKIDYPKKLLAHLDPEQGGLVFDPVRERSLESAARGIDFSELFLYFSFFLIVAALLLVGLLVRLNLDRRAAEVGVLFAAGYRRSTVFLLLLAEGILIAALGSLIGCGVAVVYARLLLRLLGLLWPGGLESSLLQFHATTQSFLIGYFAALAVSVLTIAWAVRVMGKVPPRVLLAGQTTDESEPTAERRPPSWSLWLAGGSLLLALMLATAGWWVRDHELRAGTFFGSGALLLTAGLAVVWAWMRRTRHGQVHGHGVPALTRLGVRNAARHPVRSLLTAGLLASAAFLLVAVESFRRHAGQDYLQLNSGSGGFALLAESEVPVYQDLNTDKGQLELDDGLTIRLQTYRSPQELERLQEVLHGCKYFSFRVKAGDDASCLNLYQPRRPKLLGVPEMLIQRGGFQFGAIEDDESNPWRLLNQEKRDGAIPVIGEQNTVTWILKRKLGEVFEVPGAKDDRGQPLKFRIVGLLKDSVFQSGLLMSEKNFLELYPGHEGYNLFLIDTQEQSPEEMKKLLAIALADRGVEVTPTNQRLESYLAVENTYLSTFQVLGGLGLLLGALGLAVVLLRGVWERRGELALLRALGYRHGALGWLVLAENAFLLALGLAAGTIAALLAVAPHLFAGEGQVSWLALLGMLAVVLVVSLIAGTIAVLATLRAPLVPALRQE